MFPIHLCQHVFKLDVTLRSFTVVEWNNDPHHFCFHSKLSSVTSSIKYRLVDSVRASIIQLTDPFSHC